MKIGISSPPMGPGFGGPFESVRNCARELTNLGADITVWMPRDPTATQHASAWEPTRMCMVGEIRFKPLGWSPGFARSLLASSLDILHTQGLWLHPSWVALSWKRRFHRPHVVSVRGMLEPWAWRYKAWKKRWVWWLLEQPNLRSAAMLHATSHQELRAIRARGLTNPVALIPNGVEIPSLGLDDSVRRRHDSKERIALYLGRIHPIKGLDLLVSAWGDVQPSNWKLVIAGPDESGLSASLEALAKRLGITQSVSLMGPQYGIDKERLYRDASLFILPSHSENFGVSVAEALGYAIPVIATSGTPWEELVSRRCGWWISPTQEAIAGALREATQVQAAERDAMGRRGRDWVGDAFRWNKVACQFLECYHYLVEQGRIPNCVYL